MNNYIIVTGGAGFVGSNLIELLLKKTNKKILSIDDYSSGFTRNHIKNTRIKYLKAKTVNINKILLKYRNQTDSLFHFAEFSRIYQSFEDFNQCLESNSQGTQAVFKFCLDNKMKLIYSATSATLGNKGEDTNLSP
jgi:UDP-glucose 4-epimerase